MLLGAIGLGWTSPHITFTMTRRRSSAILPPPARRVTLRDTRVGSTISMKAPSACDPRTSLLGTFGDRVVVAVDEPGEWKFGASGTNDQATVGVVQGSPTFMSSPEAKRRGALYDILFSGGNLEWYFGYGMEMDGFDSAAPTSIPDP